HILIRIYKLLNQRLPGDPEDESWTEEMEKGVGGGGSTIGRAVRGAYDRAKASLSERFGGRWSRTKAFFGRGRDRLRGWFSGFRGRAGDMLDGYRGARHDIATRYEVERRLAGRDDGVAEFYRSHLNA